MVVRAVELGFDLNYLLDKAQPYELDLIFEGLAKREENEYRRTRLAMFASLAPWGKNLQPESIFKLPSDGLTTAKNKEIRKGMLKAAKKLITDGKTDDKS